eukprot:g5309.t1
MLARIARYAPKNVAVARAGIRVRLTSNAVKPASADAVEGGKAVVAPDSMPRFPEASSVAGLLRASDYAGTIVFAASGAITAGMSGMDLLGGTIVGVITAVGGGTFRDAILLNKMPFWTSEIEYFWMAAAVAAGTFCLWKELPEGNVLKAKGGGEGPLLWWGDALGVGAFAVIGAMNGRRSKLAAVLCACCGMVTATFGGLTRDVLCGIPAETSGHGRILHSKAELYASTALLSGGVYAGMRSMAIKSPACIAAGVATGIGARMVASKHDVRLPTW